MNIVLGIDLGASYTKAVYLKDNDPCLKPVLNHDHSCVFRVCGLRTPEGTVTAVTQDEQRQRVLEQGEPTLENVKSTRGDAGNHDDVEVAVLRQVLECYRQQSGDLDLSAIGRVVLTHPVSPRPSAVEALKRIAARAGLPEDRLDTVEEPVALALFASRLMPEFSGEMFVVDAGHYTTDFVRVTFEKGRASVQTHNYLGLRLGVAELVHAIARSVWLKSQMAGGETEPAAAPFDDSGPEAADRLIRHLSAWAESMVIRGLELDLFGLNMPAYLDLEPLRRLGAVRDWMNNVRTVDFYYDASAAQEENLGRMYAKHAARRAEHIRAENYRAVVKPIGLALCAAMLATIPELQRRDDLQVVIGGGMSLIPEVETALEKLLAAHQLPRPIDLTYDYEGLGPMPMKRLLAIASGAAIAATQKVTRQDTLSDTLGVLVVHDIEEEYAGGRAILDYLYEHGAFPADFNPEKDWPAIGVRETPGGVTVVLVHHVLAHRGTPLPMTVEFSETLIPLMAGGTLNLTRPGDRSRDIELGTHASQHLLAKIRLPPTTAPGSSLKLSLEISRNDNWRLIVSDPEGRPVMDQSDTAVLQYLGRE